jgi:hypothetical protein
LVWRSRRIGIEEQATDRRSRVNAKLEQHVLGVMPGGVCADGQHARDIAIRHAAREQQRHGDLRRREAEALRERFRVGDAMNSGRHRHNDLKRSVREDGIEVYSGRPKGVPRDSSVNVGLCNARHPRSRRNRRTSFFHSRHRRSQSLGLRQNAIAFGIRAKRVCECGVRPQGIAAIIEQKDAFAHKVQDP